MWSTSIATVVVGLCVIYIFDIIKWRKWVSKMKKNDDGSKLLLPPGSMGLPFIGEALGLLVTSYSLDQHPFIKSRVQRYGSIFRTSIIGQPIVVSADQKVNNHILCQEATLVDIWFFDAFSKVLGLNSENQINSLGSLHKYARNTLLKLLGIENLKQKLLPQIEDLAKNTFKSWSAGDDNNHSSIEIRQAFATVHLNFIAKKMIGYDPETASTNLSDIFASALNGFVSFPINIPGSAYRKCLKDKEKVYKMLRDMIEERRTENSKEDEEDILDHLINDMGSHEIVSENLILHLVYATLLVSAETVSRVFLLLLKLLEENPTALQELKAEHESLVNHRDNPNFSLTWDEYKSLTFTKHVINETLRLVDVIPGLLRRAKKDITVKGFVIPAGWTVMLVASSQHFSPNIFNDPLKFDPWRWSKLEPEVVSENFMPFGGGARHCPGSEYTRVFLATFLHVLVTKYRWATIKGGEIYRNPLLGFGRKGMHVKFTKIE